MFVKCGQCYENQRLAAKSAHRAAFKFRRIKTACGLSVCKPFIAFLLCNRHLFLYVCLETVYVIYVGTVVVLFQGLVSNFVVTADFGAV